MFVLFATTPLTHNKQQRTYFLQSSFFFIISRLKILKGENLGAKMDCTSDTNQVSTPPEPTFYIIQQIKPALTC
jgi:hypothetical protein